MQCYTYAVGKLCPPEQDNSSLIRCKANCALSGSGGTLVRASGQEVVLRPRLTARVPLLR